jgi:phi13 family phage major tail protein
LEVNRLTPGDYALLFDSLYKSGYLVKSESDRAKEVALGFRAKQNNGKYEFVWYYCGKAEHPEESYETIKDKKTAQTQKITFTFYARKKEDTVDGKAKRFYALKVDESQLLEEHANAKKAIAEWFGAVQEYKADVAA